MNYLSHYYFDRNNEQPLFTTGAIFPDLLSNFDRNLKNIPKKDTGDQAPSALSDFLDGIKRHYELDRLFHSGEFFSVQTKFLSKEIEALNLPSFNHRLYFFAHILLELTLDRVLLERNPELAVQFYQKLEKTPYHLLKEYFRIYNCLPFYGDFENYLIQFIEKQFIFKYLEDNMIVEVLNKFHKQINKQKINAMDKEKLLKKLPSWIEQYKDLDFYQVLTSST